VAEVTGLNVAEVPGLGDVVTIEAKPALSVPVRRSAVCVLLLLVDEDEDEDVDMMDGTALSLSTGPGGSSRTVPRPHCSITTCRDLFFCICIRFLSSISFCTCASAQRVHRQTE
jgi:hypothetical protein